MSALLRPAAVLVLGLAAAGLPAAERELHFGVWLDGERIGEHRFLIRREGEATSVRSEAQMRVKLLWFEAYRYEHRNLEIWQGGCLRSLDSRTDDNGERQAVRAEREGGYLLVRSAGAERRLPECVRSFAYWDRELLASERLLNAQTGEYLPVRLGPAARETLEVDGRSVAARRYRLTAEGVDISLWYAADGRWLGLESRTEGGRTLRYRRL